MQWTEAIQTAIDYIEKHLGDAISYETLAKESFSSSYHFQRVFSILTGYTVGEYIRCRRLSMAGEALCRGEKVLDVALSYGYESPDSFQRAFSKFHGMKPSDVKRGSLPRSFQPLRIHILMEGGKNVKYKVTEVPEMVLVGYKRRFEGVPFGRERAKQEEEMFITTRGMQWLLRGAASDYYTDYCVIRNVSDKGYDFYIANELSAWTRENLYNREITGVDFMEKMNFEEIRIPGGLYVTAETEKSAHPMEEYEALRQSLVTSWPESAAYRFREGDELALIHWRTKTDKQSRYVEIRMPIEKL